MFGVECGVAGRKRSCERVWKEGGFEDFKHTTTVSLWLQSNTTV